jgi:hypothetical protein
MVYRSDRINKVGGGGGGGGGVLTDIPTSSGSCRRSYDFELYSECICIDIRTVAGIN